MRMNQSTPTAPETLHIKNMVCNRCTRVVQASLEKLGMHPLSVELGQATLAHRLTEEERETVRRELESWGFELIDDKRSLLVEQIKNAIIELVHYKGESPRTNLSDYLADKLHRDYGTLSKLFSETMHTTIEKYWIAQKIERAKELLVYDELTLNEIADELGYSSAAYLSTQFKSVTGLTPGYFKKIKENRRKPLDRV